MIAKDEFEGQWKQAVVDYFNLSQDIQSPDRDLNLGTPEH